MPPHRRPARLAVPAAVLARLDPAPIDSVVDDQAEISALSIPARGGQPQNQEKSSPPPTKIKCGMRNAG
jgi:hypothetical protein